MDDHGRQAVRDETGAAYRHRAKRFKTTRKNLASLMDEPGKWIDRVRQRHALDKLFDGQTHMPSSSIQVSARDTKPILSRRGSSRTILWRCIVSTPAQQNACTAPQHNLNGYEYRLRKVGLFKEREIRAPGVQTTNDRTKDGAKIDACQTKGSSLRNAQAEWAWYEQCASENGCCEECRPVHAEEPIPKPRKRT